MPSRDLSRMLRRCDPTRLLRREGRVWIVALTIGVVLFLVVGV